MREIIKYGLKFQIPIECFEEIRLMLENLTEDETILFHELWYKSELMKNWSEDGLILIDEPLKL